MADQVTFTYDLPQKSIGGFSIDAALAEHYTFQNTVTDIPVEEGSTISDHVVEEQDVVSIEAFIANAEFTAMAADGEALAKMAPRDKTARIRFSHQELLRLKREKQPVELVLGLDTFTDMLITSYSIDRDVETGADLPFSMEFKRIKIVKSETVAINASSPPPGNGAASDQVAGAANMGTAATEKPEENLAKEEWKERVVMEGKSKSILADYKRKWGVPYPQ